MTDALNPTVPAGWYPDPWGAPQHRWWDGYAWTDSLHPVATVEAPPVIRAEHQHSHRATHAQQHPDQQPPDQQPPVQPPPRVQQPPVQPSPVQQPPVQEYPGHHHPDQQYPDQRYPGQQHPGQQHPGRQHPGQQHPGQQQWSPPTVADSPYPSRRALRELAATTGTIPIIGAEDFTLSEPISAVSQPPLTNTDTEADTNTNHVHATTDDYSNNGYGYGYGYGTNDNTNGSGPDINGIGSDSFRIHDSEGSAEQEPALAPPAWTDTALIEAGIAEETGDDAAPAVPAFAPVPATVPAFVSVPTPASDPTPVPAFAAVPAPVPAPEAAVADPNPSAEVAGDAAGVAAGVAPVATDTPASVISAPKPVEAEDDWASSLGKWDEIEANTPPDARPIFGDAPPISYSQRAMRYQPLHGRTSAVWFIVFMPILQSIAVTSSLYLFPGALSGFVSAVALTPTQADLAAVWEWMLFAATPLTLVFFVFTMVMGFQDRARLRLLGHDQTASPWWLLLHSLVYLIVRSVRVQQSTGRKGSGPLTTYICVYIAPSIAAVIATVVISALNGAIPG